MKTQVLLLALLLPALSQAQKFEYSKHAVAVNYEIFLFTASPYLEGLSNQGLKYDYIFGDPGRVGLSYLSTGVQLMRFREQSYLAIPAELCVGTSVKNILSLHAGAGGIIHTGGQYLQPAIFFTIHSKLRIKFGKSPMFMDLEFRGLNSYAYGNSNGRRSGSAFSPGAGLSFGAYF